MENTTDNPVSKVDFDIEYRILDKNNQLSCDVVARSEDKALYINSLDYEHLIIISHENVIKLKNYLNQLY